MREFEQKRKIRKILSSPLVLIPLGVIFLFLIKGTWDIYLKNRIAAEELRVSQEVLARLQSRQQFLAAAAQKLSTESGVENEIRDRFQMAKQGEKEIIILEGVTGQNEPPPPAKGLLQKIWDFFTIR